MFNLGIWAMKLLWNVRWDGAYQILLVSVMLNSH